MGHLVSPESSACCIVAMAAGSSGVDRRALVGASVGLEYGGRPSAEAGGVRDVPAVIAAAAVGVLMPPLVVCTRPAVQTTPYAIQRSEA